MATRIVRDEVGAEGLRRMIVARGRYPLTVTITAGEGRRSRQNRLAQRWFTDIAVQLGDRTHEDIRAYCKLHFGVPILRAGNEAFRQQYDKIVRPLPYEDKLDAVKALDLPVTRLMTVKQMSAFMEEVQREFLPMGVRLTDPEALKYQEEIEN